MRKVYDTKQTVIKNFNFRIREGRKYGI